MHDAVRFNQNIGVHQNHVLTKHKCVFLDIKTTSYPLRHLSNRAQSYLIRFLELKFHNYLDTHTVITYCNVKMSNHP